VIIAVTGMRRVGKSVLLRQLRDELADSGQAVYIDKESLDYDEIENARVRSLCPPAGIPDKLLCQFRVAHTAAGRFHNDRVNIIFRTIKIKSVYVQEHKGGCQRNSFIPVDQGMVVTQMKGVCRGHLRNCLMQIVFLICRLRDIDGGTQERQVPDPVGAAVSAYLVFIDKQDFRER